MSEHGRITMSPPPALAYLLPRADSFWRWSRDGRTIDWTDGWTIAFREEVQAVLARLAPRGLPPFGAVVLLLAATRDAWGEGAENAERIIRHARASIASRDVASSPGAQLVLTFLMPHALQQEVRDTCGELSAVAALPAELRRTLRARCAIAEFVFEGGAHRGSAEAASAVVELLASGIDAETLRRNLGESNADSALAAELESLRAGLVRVAAEPLSAFVRTGLDATVRAPELELPAAPRVRALLRDLRADAELAGVAKLAQDVLAALHVPRALVSPEEVPVGGVSDISNRGPLDRLLISELAHDELTLAIRVALNEALYLRRESPAQHPPFTRSILIDSGIRLWGVPRLFAAGVALALAASADPRAPVRTFRASGSTVADVDLTTRQGLAAQLEALEPHPHPGPSLRPWLDATESPDVVDAAASETFIVTHADVFADPEFATALRAADPQREWQVATVARDGTFALWNVGPAGRRQLCGATLSLDDVLSERRSAAKALPLVSTDADLPAILFMHPLPLLLPARVEPRHAVYTPQIGLVGVTGDRRLMRWTSEVKGGEQLAPALPRGQIFGLLADVDRERVHVVVAEQCCSVIHVITAHLREGRIETRAFPCKQPKHVFFDRGVIGLAYHDRLRRIDTITWSESEMKLEQNARWLNGRFLQVSDGLAAASASSIDFVAKIFGVWAFDVADEGPWILQAHGPIGPALGPYEPPPAELQVQWCYLRGVSPDGRRIVINAYSKETARFTGLYTVDIDTQKKPKWAKWKGYPQNQYAALLADARALSHGQSFNIHWRFSGVTIGRDGILALAHESRVYEFHLRNDDLFLSYAPDVRRVTSREWTTQPDLERTQVPGAARYQLRRVRWSDGSRAFLDSRGLLHLISSDKRLPQLTLTLTNRAVAGWSSEGQTFGWSYFLKDKPTSDAAYALSVLREFTRRLR